MLEEQIIDLGENDEVAVRYLNEELYVSDINDNQAAFREKSFLSKF